MSTEPAALIARAITDVQRIWSIKESKQAMTNLLQKGQVGDDLCERLAFAEQELEVELAEVVAEANEYADGWGQVIFSIASEAAQANKARDVYKNIEKERQNKGKPVCFLGLSLLQMDFDSYPWWV